jgi:hypothetical protein
MRVEREKRKKKKKTNRDRFIERGNSTTKHSAVHAPEGNRKETKGN